MQKSAPHQLLLAPEKATNSAAGQIEGYTPRPLETSSVSLGNDILKLTDTLAENSHEVWARERMAQGWRWGPVRDDARKIHPAVMPYKELSEADKHVNRQVALESLKMAISLGVIKSADRPNEIASRNIADLDPVAVARETKALLKDEALTLTRLRAIWEERLPLVWLRDVALYRLSSDAALRLGEWFFAFDVADEGLTGFPGDLRLTQLKALALARTGATRRANKILEELRASGNNDEETLGILARTHKDFWQIANDPAEREAHLKTSYELYKEAYRRNQGYYSGINAAALAFLSDDTNNAQQFATEVVAMCRARLEESTPDERYWLEATLAEATLILGDLDLAVIPYSMAAQLAGKQWARLNRTREQARLLLHHSGRDPRSLDACFKLPRIVVCSGHMFDRPDRMEPRFPFAMRDEIYREIEQKLAEMDAGVGFCSLACGSDMMFADAILKRGGELHVVLPFNAEDFKAASVNRVPGFDFSAEFNRLLKQAASVTVLNTTGRASDGAVYDYCNHVLFGMALLKGRVLGIEVKPLIVWDGKEGDGRGGTSSFIRLCRELGREIELISLKTPPAAPQQTSPGQSAPARAPRAPAPPQLSGGFPPQEVKALLFADVKGYTKLSEIQIPAFVRIFLSEVAAMMDSMENPPPVRNTWGDALYCVFDDVTDAGIFAIMLQSFILKTDWKSKGLTSGLNIRIALHAGPVYRHFDPITQKQTYLGSHVSRTARIEPIAEEDQIFSSQAFAAYAEVKQCKGFICDYVGQKRLPKNFGSIPVFLVRSTSTG